MEPSAVSVVGMIGADPQLKLNRVIATVFPESLLASLQLPESKLESIVMGPKLKVRWEGGVG